MEPWEKEEADAREAAVTELLDGYIPSLVTDSANARFLARLTAAPKGRWHATPLLCEGEAAAEAFFAELARWTDETPYVLWLDAPPPDDLQYIYIHFYFPDYFWTKSAVYNRLFLPE